jgi:glucosamine kinase
MILIADSGSTKTDWVVLSNKKIVFKTTTIGLNPLFRSKAEIRKAIRKINLFRDLNRKVTAVNFFGAGCGDKKGKEKIESSLHALFPMAKITVQTDLMGAALATCGNKKGIVCILGTGSNCCYFDGKKIHQGKAGLGYILGDEASGAYFGKILLKYFLYDKFSRPLSEDFERQYKISRVSAIENVYKKPHPNMYLASLAPFILKWMDKREVKEIIKNGLNEFYETSLAPLKNHKTLPVHFVGSVAFYLEDFINEFCRQKKIVLGTITQKPIEALANYHLAKKN